MTTPCTRWDAAADKRCGGTPTRLYNVGHRCPACTPAALAGQPEPPTGYCAPHRHYCPPDHRCATWAAQQPLWRVLATGGRDRTDKPTIWATFDGIRKEHPRLVVVHGAAYPKPVNGVRPDRSADWLTHLWCQANPTVIEQPYPADWNSHGRAAGPIRNAEMVKSGADECVAFPGEGPGTRDCMKKAADAGVRVRTLLPPITDQDATFAKAAGHA
jgi:hypothetical protein